MVQQYIRKVSLLVGSDTGEGLDLSELHLNFAVWSSTAQTLRHARIRIYNASDETVQRIQTEFTRVILQAGYDGNFGLIFSGTVAQYSRGRESATDTYLDIVAQDSDQAYNYAVMNVTLAKGWTYDDYYKSLLDTFAPYGVTAGYRADFPKTVFPRGKPFFGMAREYMREFAAATGMRWYIQDGLLNVIPLSGYLPNEAIVLSADTGMIGIPVQTLDGVIVRCLMNSNIITGGRVQIDNASITQTTILAGKNSDGSPNSGGPKTTNPDDYNIPSLSNDGLYVVYSLTHAGDTRGNAWETQIICFNPSNAPKTTTFTNAVIDGQPATNQ
ncbi:hypothetical protein AX768_25275 [Burkholderia sp. PAMC 28687]|uniref:phage protein n=1 Tax=Burkholderia sp. PAMC 28687 TaxID=1795874 RepID=UPI0007822132|nr:hypothetical protein [Burkholderia sp. PAMC 28687]AMM17514.1 hypothetical protein AX768_25275 [Burkholderia sp. PAMC 28687]